MSWRLRLIVVVSLFLLVLVILSFSAGRREDLSYTGKALGELTASLQHGVMASARAVEDFWRGYFFLVGLREENESLHKALDRLRGRVNTLREDHLANRRLKGLLNFKTRSNLAFAGAKVVAWDPNAWFKAMTIDRGSRDGVRPGMPVVSGRGVVGRIVGVTPHYAKVLLLIDYNSSVDAFVQRTRARGILAGRSGKTCSLKYVLKNDDLVQGDVIVTSGMGGVFPKGIPLGLISRVRKLGHDIFQEVEVVPAVDFTKLEEVAVILTKEQPF